MDYAPLRRIITELPKTAAASGEPTALKALEEELSRLSVAAGQLSAERQEREMDDFRRLLLPTLLQSELGYYIFAKPRGFAGDYKTQEMIWLGRTEGGKFRYAGITDVGRYLTALTLDMAAPRANEYRVRRLRDTIAAHGPKIASIGCGSCIELWEPLTTPIEDAFLLDHDAEALQRAMTRIDQNGIKAHPYNDNVLKFILRNARRDDLGTRNMIYAFGLLDYFPLATAKRLVLALWPNVMPGGMLLLTNGHPDNPTRLWMEWGSDWFLDYKTPDEMRSLVAGLADVDTVHLSTDPFGVYQYLEIHKAG